MKKEDFYTRFKKLKTCVIIPTYNNQSTIFGIIEDVMKYTDQIMVVNDGSTDNTSQMLSNYSNIDIIQYSKNKGKGFAIREGFKKSFEAGYEYVITIDADGQHYADDLPLFLDVGW
jgi:glycosyltransferase involved in cell wall biosynthesis